MQVALLLLGVWTVACWLTTTVEFAREFRFLAPIVRKRPSVILCVLGVVLVSPIVIIWAFAYDWWDRRGRTEAERHADRYFGARFRN